MKGRVQMSLLTNTYDVHKGEFETAGDASASIKRKLKQLGVDSTLMIQQLHAKCNRVVPSLNVSHNSGAG